MALYREGKAAMAADGTVTGTGTNWQSSLSLIRPGATIMFLSSPIQMAVVNKVVSDTEIKAITTNGAVVASTDYSILLSDSLTVDGLAQDVAETLRYYQSQETVIAEALDFFKDFDFEALQNLANQIKADSEAAESSAAAAAASENAAKTSETNSKASEVAAETARDQVQQIINDAGEQSTLVVLAKPSGASSIGVDDGLTLRDITISSVTAFMAMNISPPKVIVDGFYTRGDGGEGVWISTGQTDISKAGKHVPEAAKIYNAAGAEYVLSIKSGRVKVFANGAKNLTISEATATHENYVCYAQVLNGIGSLLSPAIYSNNTNVTYTGGQRVIIDHCSIQTRYGRADIKAYSGVKHEAWGLRLFLSPGPSTTYAATGRKINGLSHGYDEVMEKWIATGRRSYWGSVSLQNFAWHGGSIYGDQAITKYSDQCTSGVGCLILNGEGVEVDGLHVENFNWAKVCALSELEETEYRTVDGYNFDDNVKDYKYVMTEMVAAGVTSRIGNFNRVAFRNCKFVSGRRGVVRNACDWTTYENCEVINRLAWRSANNVSGDIPDFIMVATGTVMDFTGCYISPAAAKDYNAKIATIATSAQQHRFGAIYNEWDYNSFYILPRGFIGPASRLQGLAIDCMGVYKDDFINYNQITFAPGCFGTIDDKGQYKYPDIFSHYDTPNGQSYYVIGRPVRDRGAFRHGGFDGKYGPYNMFVLSGSDWDSWRDRPYAREMFNSYGFQANSGTYLYPWQNPAPKSQVCIWIKDFTGNFNPQKIVAWQTAAGQEGGNADAALYKSFAERVIDFGNGYRLLVLTNKRLTAWDGLYSYARNATIQIEVAPETPIAIIAIEAYTGGIPFFPNGCGEYMPESPATSVLSAVSNYVGFDSSIGGGIFMPGDMIAPWVHVRRQQSGFRIAPSITSGYNLTNRLVTGGMTLEASFKVSFTATVVSVDSTNGLTTISVPTEKLPYVAVGIPLYIVSGSTTGTTGQVHLHRRVMNSEGKATNQYVVNGIIGAAGDSLAVDQSNIPSYTMAT